MSRIILDPDVQAAKRMRIDSAQTSAAVELARNLAHGQRRGADWQDPEAKPSGLVTEPGELEVSSAMQIICKEIADFLAKTYPGWLWAIHPQEFGGLVNIRNLTLHEVWGYRIKVSALQNDLHNLTEAKRGAGEILERFGVPRGPYNDRARRALAERRRDVRGNFIPDTTDKDRNLTHAEKVERDMQSGRLTVHNIRGHMVARKNW